MTELNPAKLFIVLGAILMAAGCLLAVAQKLGLGRLPGDIVVQRDRFTFVFPIVSCILISAVLTLLLWIVAKLRGF